MASSPGRSRPAPTMRRSSRASALTTFTNRRCQSPYAHRSLRDDQDLRDAPAESIARLEVDLKGDAGPHLVDLCLDAEPDRRWSLDAAWEQEYRDVDGLLGVYQRHPFHWTHAVRWFGCEVPTSIVLLALAHVYRWADGPVLP